MNIPTTFDIVGDRIYLLANSQLENLDQDKNEILRKEELTNTYIIVIDL